MKPLVAATTAGAWCLGLTGCITVDRPEATGIKAPVSSNYSTDGVGLVPALPVDYRGQIAIRLVSEYNIEASGPPEISEVITTKALLGNTTQVIVRYPVNLDAVTRGRLLFASSDKLYYRCSAIRAHKGVTTFGSSELSVLSEKYPSSECGVGFNYKPFKELIELADECRKPNGACEVSRTYPGRSITVTTR